MMMIMGRQYRGHKACLTVKIIEATDRVDLEEVVASLQPHSTTPSQWEEFVRSRGSEYFQVKIYIINLINIHNTLQSVDGLFLINLFTFFRRLPVVGIKPFVHSRPQCTQLTERDMHAWRTV